MDFGLRTAPLASLHDFSSVRVGVAGPGASPSLGSLSVPAGWPTSNTTLEPVSPPVPAADPAPRVAKSFQQGLMGMVAGRRAITENETD